MLFIILRLLNAPLIEPATIPGTISACEAASYGSCQLWELSHSTNFMIGKDQVFQTFIFPEKGNMSMKANFLVIGCIFLFISVSVFYCEKFWLMNLFACFANQPTVLSGMVSRGMVLGCGCCGIGDRYQVSHDRWHMTCDRWNMTIFFLFCYFVLFFGELVLLSAHIEIFSIFCSGTFFEGILAKNQTSTNSFLNHKRQGFTLKVFISTYPQ